MDIYYRDLTPETQAKVLELHGLKTPDEDNWDIFPLFVLDAPESEKVCDCMDAREMCYNVAPDEAMHCTRPNEHEGEHVACGLGDYHRLQVWAQ